MQPTCQRDRRTPRAPRTSGCRITNAWRAEPGGFGRPSRDLLGSVASTSDADYYTLTVPSFAHVRAEVIEGNAATATCDSNQMDSELVLYDATGTMLVRDDDSGRGYCSLIDGTGTAPRNPTAMNTTATPQIFHLLARHSTLPGSGLDAFPYRVQVTIR